MINSGYVRSLLGTAYSAVYDLLCGVHPNVFLWHIEWLPFKHIREELKRIMGTLEGIILDVGCRDKPYKGYLNASKVRCHLGIDVVAGPGVDVIVPSDNVIWPFKEQSFDSIMCLQVLPHVADVPALFQEAARCLKKDGLLIVTTAFMAAEHSGTLDFHRFSATGLARFCEPYFDLIVIRKMGGAGSTVGSLLIKWLDAQLNRNKASRILKGLALPLWIAITFIVNCTGYLIDKVDSTGVFYNHVMLVAKKR